MLSTALYRLLFYQFSSYSLFVINGAASLPRIMLSSLILLQLPMHPIAAAYSQRHTSHVRLPVPLCAQTTPAAAAHGRLIAGN
jgi:hypothetical protein